MLAYKFRSASQLHFALDIILNNRLHCSDWRELNDPMEGQFAYSYRATDEQDHSEEVAEIISHKRRLLVCSLSRTFNCHLLWAHYASGFSGLAIELELPEWADNVRVVEYREVFGHVLFDRVVDPAQAAEEILSSKYNEWAYEQEVRILQPGKWYPLHNRVKRVIAGHRMDPAVFEALRIACKDRKVALTRTGIGNEGIDADYVPPLGATAQRKRKPEGKPHQRKQQAHLRK